MDLHGENIAMAFSNINMKVVCDLVIDVAIKHGDLQSADFGVLQRAW